MTWRGMRLKQRSLKKEGGLAQVDATDYAEVKRAGQNEQRTEM
jgi:hypothetical protein